MLRLSKIVKSYKETGALSENVSVFGFLDNQVFLTKGGDVGAVMRVEGVDYECLDHKQTDDLTKRLESALRLLGPQYRVYQILFKSSGETIPHGEYDNPVVRQAVDDRTAYFERKAGELYSLQIYYVILYEGMAHHHSITRAIARLASEPREGLEELRGFLSSKKQTLLIGSAIDRQHRTLRHQVRSLILHLSDFVAIETCGKQEAFKVLKRLLNFSPTKIAHARLKYDTHVDYFLADSALECYTMRDNFKKSLLFMEAQLANSVAEAYRKNHTVEGYLQNSSAPDIDIDVGKVSIEDLRSAPYKATVDFYEIAYSPAEHVEIKRTLYTAHFVFLFRDSVPNDLIQANPLGLAITYFREDQAFQ